MSKEKWFVNDGAKKYEWREVNDDLPDNEAYSHRYKVLFLAVTVFINSAVSSALFIGIVRTVVMKIYPSAPVEWLVPELQTLAYMAIMWVTIIQCMLIMVHARIGRLIANGEQ